MFNMFKKKDVKKSKDMPENNNNSSGNEELSDDELFNVSGGRLTSDEKVRYSMLCRKDKKENLTDEERKEYRFLNLKRRLF